MSVASAVATLRLPGAEGSLENYALGPALELPEPSGEPPRTRVAYAAAHVVADPLAPADPHGDAALDWGATLAFRHHLWRHGLGVAEAMDTAQRGMGLGWAAARELIARTAVEARSVGGALACGAGTDQLAAGTPHSLERIRNAYLEQAGFVADQGATVVLMASRALAATAGGPDDYRDVYDRVLGSLDAPVILHWLGEAFDPALAGYWGAADPSEAAELMLELIDDHRERIDGIKVSLLDRELEVSMRARLPDGVRMYTGDDFNYPELIRGDESGHSDALLGVLDPITPIATAALAALDEGRLDRYDELLAPTVALSRHIFEAPTRYYKTGVVLCAYLNGHQRHFRMVGGLESARSTVHLAELVRLADRAGALRDPELAAARMRPLLQLAGVSQP